QIAGKNTLPQLKSMRVLAKLGDSITTDHISPAGNIAVSSPAGHYLKEKNIKVRDFNSYGSRRGNHHIMTRGTLANTRLHNELADGKEGGYTTYFPMSRVETIFSASQSYQEQRTELLILAGKEYGKGSERDRAGTGVNL